MDKKGSTETLFLSYCYSASPHGGDISRLLALLQLCHYFARRWNKASLSVLYLFVGLREFFSVRRLTNMVNENATETFTNN